MPDVAKKVIVRHRKAIMSGEAWGLALIWEGAWLGWRRGLGFVGHKKRKTSVSYTHFQNPNECHCRGGGGGHETVARGEGELEQAKANFKSAQ